MKATALEFRLRILIFLLIYVLGFVAPWDFVLHLDGTGPNAHVWGRLAVMLSRNGAMTIDAAFNAVLIAGILFAAVGAWMRTWGSAYLSVDVMSDRQMRGDGLVADGPYRYVRNPLYLGNWIDLPALALLMPASGAIFALVLLVLFQMRLILGEEAFLRDKLGEPYLAYCAKVPRLLPALRPRVAGSGARPQWRKALVAENFMWGVTASFAVLGWRYDANLLLQCVVVWVGISLIVSAFRTEGQAG